MITKQDAIVTVLDVGSEDIFDLWEVSGELGNHHPLSTGLERRLLLKEVIPDLVKRGWINVVRYHWRGDMKEPPLPLEEALAALADDRNWDVPTTDIHVGIVNSDLGNQAHCGQGPNSDDA